MTEDEWHKSEDRFVRKWTKHVAGAIACGHGRARIVLVGSFKEPNHVEKFLEDLEGETIVLLKQLHVSLVPKPAPSAQAAAPVISPPKQTQALPQRKL